MLLDERTSLPASLRAWRDITPIDEPRWQQPWEALSSFFVAAGYQRFRAHSSHSMTYPDESLPPYPALDSFGLYGDRSELKSRFFPFSQVVAARDRENRDVVIKVVSKGDEGRRELEILQLLNSEPLRSDPANATVPVLEFLEFHDWHFVVMPFCDQCDELPFLNVSEGFDFADQILAGLTFLHENRIAHLDISCDNILINHHGTVPQTKTWTTPSEPIYKIWPPPEWRSTFPARYLFMDFGYSQYFEKDMSLDKCRAEPFPQGRKHRAPEMRRATNYNPFAADVYATARTLYGWLKDAADETPSLLILLRDMTSQNPSRRPTAKMALERFRALRSTIPDEKLLEVHELELINYSLVPRSFIVMFRDLIETRQWTNAYRFTWISFKMWITKTLRVKPAVQL
ncbi:hypothetical protein HETIRDRAFT_419877 [Heterobasidion irregulare TC 32-1]|uniref:Protein kinase domain-containing protein n=1 Tax=Heterobasidion irregulare (strain TC 32-1) TaxID=747525 RepID=W4JYT9_HETIT|nr:uncharacterized protein HETIRDRAFT_419877 [Heterobasidion irregulare TC 32-1]ETW78624.1 hypothetical protein HETIRDRAFT_419877 [Heterobasidion irregulare TC 32-1]